MNTTNVNNEEMIDLSKYWYIIKKSKVSIILMTIFFIGIGVIVSSSITPSYKATTKIISDPQQPNANKGVQNISNALISLYHETQYEIIKSKNIAETVIDKLNLIEKFKKSEITPEQAELSDIEIKALLTVKIQENIEITGGKQSQIINISYKSNNAEEAAEIVNTITDSYIEFGLQARFNKFKQTESWLSNQYNLLEQNLKKSEKKLAEYRSTQGLVNTSQQSLLENKQLQSLNDELIQAQTKLIVAEEEYLSVKNIPNDSPQLYSLSSVSSDQNLSDLIKDKAKLALKVNQLFERYGEKHPKMIEARSSLKSVNETLTLELQKIVNNIKSKYESAKAQVENIKGLIEENRRVIQKLQSDNFTLIALEREVENNRRVAETFQLNLIEASGKSEYSASNVSIVDRAVTPLLPDNQNKKLIIVLATILGLGIGSIIAIIRDGLDSTLKSPDLIEDKLGLTSLGSTPYTDTSKSNILEPMYLSSSLQNFTESINTLRSGLLFSNIEQPPKTILITSSLAKEGKSTTAINLASSLSKLGKTLLLEVDLRMPTVDKKLSLDKKLGLSDLIVGTAKTIEEVIHHKDELSIITSGTPLNSPQELLSSHKFDQTLATLQTHFDYIILDGPPTLPISDAGIIASKVDSVLLVIKAESTNIEATIAATKRLNRLNANIIGAVLTCTSESSLNQYGDYYTQETYGQTSS